LHVRIACKGKPAMMPKLLRHQNPPTAPNPRERSPTGWVLAWLNADLLEMQNCQFEPFTMLNGTKNKDSQEVRMLRRSVYTFILHITTRHIHIHGQYATSDHAQLCNTRISQCCYPEGQDEGRGVSLGPLVNCRPLSTSMVLISPSILLLQWPIPIFNMVSDYLGSLISSEVAPDSLHEITLWICA
jgi:hypothetical protein